MPGLIERSLEELYQDLPERSAKKRKPPSAPTLVSVRKAPADAESEHAQ